MSDTTDALRDAAQAALEELERIRPQNQSAFHFRVVENLRAALAQAGAGREPTAEIVTVRHFHEYEGSALEDTTGYLVTSVRLLGPEPTKEGTQPLYFGAAHPSPAQREPLSDEQIDSAPPLPLADHSVLVGRRELRQFGRQIEAACAKAWGVEPAGGGTKGAASPEVPNVADEAGQTAAPLLATPTNRPAV